MSGLRPALLALLLLAHAAPSQAALDPQLKQPYQLRVVLHIADNRFLTPLFQEQVQRELGDHLRLALGSLAEVNVVRSHPLLRDIEARGLGPVLDGWEEYSQRQTHFVLLDHVAGQYRLQARSHDGLTGQAGELVQQEQTNDRALVPRLAAQLVEQAFSPVGVVTGVGKEVRLTLRGGGLGVPLERWAAPGQVFAVSRIVQDADGQRAQRLDWALLEVLEAPRDGVCRCRYWHRFQEDQLQQAPGVLGFRARKLPTARGPVRLRLIDSESFRPLDGVQLQVARPGSDKKVEVTTNRDGLAATSEAFAHFALVRVVTAGQVRAQLPVEVIEDRVVVCRIKVQGESETLVAAEYRRDAWLRRVYENSRLATDRVTELNILLGRSLEAALEAGRSGAKHLSSEITYLAREREELRRLARDKQLPAERFDLRDGEQELAKLRQREEDLKQFVGRIEDVLKEASTAESLGLHKMLEQARLLESEAEIEPAIRLYEKVLQVSPEQAKIRAHLEQLKKTWETKNPKLIEAREFVYQVWPKLDVAGLDKNLKRATEVLQVLRGSKDRFTALKLQRSNAIHAANLKKHLETLRRKDTEDNRNQARIVLQVSEGLRQLHSEVLAFLGRPKEQETEEGEKR